jgi:hypothetical protein
MPVRSASNSVRLFKNTSQASLYASVCRSVYAVGYIFRPLGSLLFGHICDVHGEDSRCRGVLSDCTACVLHVYCMCAVCACRLLSWPRLLQPVCICLTSLPVLTLSALTKPHHACLD